MKKYRYQQRKINPITCLNSRKKPLKGVSEFITTEYMRTELSHIVDIVIDKDQRDSSAKREKMFNWLEENIGMPQEFRRVSNRNWRATEKFKLKRIGDWAFVSGNSKLYYSFAFRHKDQAALFKINFG